MRLLSRIALSSLALTAPALAAPTLVRIDADGVCSPEDEAAGLCFQTDPGFVVEVVLGPNGEFPVIDDQGNSVFTYLVTGPGAAGNGCAGVQDVSHGAIQVPVCDDGSLVVVDSMPQVDHQTNGQGDPSCGFGVGDTSVDVIKWDVGVPCNGSAVWSMTLAGHVGTQLVEFQLKDANNCRTGWILGPACPENPEVLCDGLSGCPCGNDTAVAGEGCANSTGSGASLGWSGSTSVAADDLVLHATGLPAGEMAILLMAKDLSPVTAPLNSGLLCIGGPGIKIIRMSGAKPASDSGELSFGPGLVALSCSGAVADPALFCIAPGTSWNFQLYYRDTDLANPCQPAIANTTSALRVLFTN